MKIEINIIRFENVPGLFHIVFGECVETEEAKYVGVCVEPSGNPQPLIYFEGTGVYRSDESKKIMKRVYKKR